MNIDRRTLLLGVAATPLIAPRAHAPNGLPFDAAAFKAAQAAGKTIVIEVTAKWCGPCERQRPVVAKLLENPEFAKLTMFDADYDEHKKESPRNQRSAAYDADPLPRRQGSRALLRSDQPRSGRDVLSESAVGQSLWNYSASRWR